MLKHLCPCCNRHCYLDEPRCERGEIFAKTGVIPPREPKTDGSQGRKPHSEMKKIYRSLDQDSKLVWMLRKISSTTNSLTWDAQSEPDDESRKENSGLFACLREEEKKDLLMLLEKASYSWYHAQKKRE